MKQIVGNEFGCPEKLISSDIPLPSTGDGQIVIKVEASGVNFSEAHRQMENRKKTDKTVLIP